MENKKSIIHDVISELDYLSLGSEMITNEEGLQFNVIYDLKCVDFVTFAVTILPSYPYKLSETESIRFKNKELIEYNHVMSDGSICFHNIHRNNFQDKLRQDFESVKNWIQKYIIDEEQDEHYEFPIKHEACIDNEYYSFLFTDIDKQFEKGDFGEVNLSYMTTSRYHSKNNRNYIVKSFIHNLAAHDCGWSKVYFSIETILTGLFYFTGVPPVKNKRFLIHNWKELSRVIDQKFIDEIWKFCFQARGFDTKKHKRLPIFLGYKTPDNTIHWEVTLIDIDNFFENKKSIEETGNFSIKEFKVDWAITQNCSYQYFFGRGAFSPKLTDKKILIIGVGAIGSQVSRTLTKSGCRNLTLTDYDQKNPENVCRSEFDFFTGLSDKVSELASILMNISPFVDLHSIPNFITEYGLKLSTYAEHREKIKEALNSFDYIFDCSTDDDLMFLLDSLEIKTQIFNLSISNHAKELVCGLSPNVYRAFQHQFKHNIKNDTEDLYNPTGCWSPTFKASYNDIATLVQFALLHINNQLVRELPLHNFVVKYDNEQINLGINRF
ncbi:ThiF family adenylyltransferase [Pasteurella atlantica]|uniref:ThiF family adenylyltransferase n=1 Tax=Phocoenobacter atlanticus TaxID=3416742 RepID=UPI001BC9EC11|nr:ThiF family adenylyltransferase [Pasteurella atlantica]MDP8159847.1 ThiF family adenylyltransferase [Pasteurella atlantica]QVE20385.1 ThiF family adenylyltransferase [Pasteurella atlantica]